MSRIPLNPLEVYKRGLEQPDSLSPDEYIVFVVIDLECLSAMEGWDHFFCYDRQGNWGKLKASLARVGDITSLKVIEDYEASIQKHGFPLNPEGVEDYLDSLDNEDLAREPDWREEFDNNVENRWALIKEYLLAQGIDLLTEDPMPAAGEHEESVE